MLATLQVRYAHGWGALRPFSAAAPAGAVVALRGPLSALPLCAPRLLWLRRVFATLRGFAPISRLSQRSVGGRFSARPNHPCARRPAPPIRSLFGAIAPNPPPVRLPRLPFRFSPPCNPLFPSPFVPIGSILGRGGKPIGQRMAGSGSGTIVGRHPLLSFVPPLTAA